MGGIGSLFLLECFCLFVSEINYNYFDLRNSIYLYLSFIFNWPLSMS